MLEHLVNKYKDIVNLQAWAGAYCASLPHSLLHLYWPGVQCTRLKLSHL